MRVLLLWLVTATVFVACGDAGAGADAHAVGSARPSAPADGAIPWLPTLASPTPSPAPTPALAPCRPEDVGSTFGQWGAATGNNVGEFTIAPKNGTPCALPANPAIRFVTKYGQPLPEQPALSARATVPLVVSAGNGRTFLDLVWPNHGAEPGWTCQQRSLPLQWLDVSLGGGWLRLAPFRDPITLCLDPLERVFVQITAPDAPQPPRPEPIFDARIVAPDEARAGDHMRYLVRLTNRTATPQRFAACPAYVQNIAGPQELGSSDRPGWTYVERRQPLNCAGLGDISPGETVTFEMFFDIPRDALPGVYVLPWRLDGPVFGVGAKQTFRLLP